MIISEPKREIEIDENLIARLIQEQFPSLSELSITFIDAGWDNESYRLGADYLVRIPRRFSAAKLIHHEIQWLPLIDLQHAIKVPKPIHVGKPTEYYPWNWTIIPWFEGETAESGELQDSEIFSLVDFLQSLHRQPLSIGRINPSRGIDLEIKSKDVLERIARLRKDTDLIGDRIEARWHQALNAAKSTSDSLIHGDLHPRNIIVNEGHFEAIIDWGDITQGDPANDLSSLWMLFDAESLRLSALEHYGASDALIHRAMGWAIFFGTVLLDTGRMGNQKHAKIGAQTLRNINSMTTQ